MENGWPDNPKYLGKKNTRVDGPLKVTGRAKYASDQQPPGLLYGMILRSPWPAARLNAVDLAPALAVPGIKAALLVQDVPRSLYYYGDEIAAVAGTSTEACEEALRLIRLEATPQPHVVDEVKALKANAARVFADQSNVSSPAIRETGNVDQAFAEAAAVVEGEYHTQIQNHHSLETHGHTAWWNGEELTVWASTQAIFGVRDGIADAVGLDQSKVRVLSPFMGGGFGSKFNAGVEGVMAARLSMETRAPVKLMLSRAEESLAVGNRPSTYQKIRLAADGSGQLTGFELIGYGTGGFASGGETEGGGGGSTIPAPYIYQIPNVRSKQYGIAINAGSGAAMRAPGHPPASFGMESIMDEMAVKLGMDPVALRLKNDPSEIRRREYEVAVERFRWKERYQAPGASTGPVKKGIGCGGATWGGGGRGTQAEVQINPDGTVEVRCGTQDLGTGTTTLIAIIAAEALGITPDQVTPRLGDTRFPPSGGSGGSTTAPSVSPAIWDASEKALAELKRVSGMDDVSGDHWKKACGAIGVNPLVIQGRWREGLSSSGAGGVQMAEVEVDTETGFVKLNEILVVQDCGMVVNKLTAESQINGGVIMGMGYALYERRVMDDRSGMVINPNFETYKLPGPEDMPKIDIVLLNMPERGVIGMGEPVTIPTAAAISNAVANALGVRVNSIPITPDKVLAALGKVPNAQPEDLGWSELMQAG